jgi:hypothetical protein
MNSDIKTYHFANPSNEKILRFVNKISHLNTVLCFDLEDFSRDVFYRKANKSIHRENVINTIGILINSSSKQKIGLRINSYGTDEFCEDIILLENLRKRIMFECIFLPKIKDDGEIKKCLEVLEKSKINIKELIPIIESKSTFNNLKEITSSLKDVLKKFAFGHCDFNYDNGNFPFYHQDSEQYWEWIDLITDVLKLNNKVFINSPYLFLNDEQGYIKMLNRLSQKTGGIFGQITLSLNQIEKSSFYKINPIQKNIGGYNDGIKSGEETLAKLIIKDYENNSSAYRSFAIDENRFVISPQEYLAAKRYLKELECVQK